jgi:hypothetical protein
MQFRVTIATNCQALARCMNVRFFSWLINDVVNIETTEWLMNMEQVVEWNRQGKPKCLMKTCHFFALSTANLRWFDLGLNPDCSGGKSTTNRLSNGTAVNLSNEVGHGRMRALFPPSFLYWYFNVDMWSVISIFHGMWLPVWRSRKFLASSIYACTRRDFTFYISVSFCIVVLKYYCICLCLLGYVC